MGDFVIFFNLFLVPACCIVNQASLIHVNFVAVCAMSVVIGEI
jgi:hypothetical protein